MAALSSLIAASMVTSGAAALSGAYANSQALKTQGEIGKVAGEINTRFAKLGAEDAIARGDKDAVRVRKDAGRLIGRQRAAAAAQGIEVDSGSAAAIEQDTRVMGALDAVTVRNNAWREAMGYRVQAVEATARGQYADIGGRAASRATILSGSLEAGSYALRAGYYAGGGK